MQTIYAYSYNPSIATGTNTTKTVWRMAYQQPILLYKGTANTIKLIVFNNAQKVVDLTNYDVQVQIVDKDTQEHYVTRTATISSPTTGIAQITFTEPDLRNLQHRFYHIIARLMPPNDGSTVINGEILYLDDNYGAFTPVTIEDAWNFNPTNISVTDGESSFTFTNIGETPNSLTGYAGQYLRVNAQENSLEFTASTSGLVTWADVVGKPSFANVATTGSYNDLSNKPSLATVATTGSYVDLTNKPSVPNLLATGNIIPSANVTYSLGNVNYQWRDLYVSNNTIYLNGIPLSVDGSGNLTVNGSPVSGTANTGNIIFAAATISTASTNQDMTLDPNGTGNVVITGNVNASGAVTAARLISNIATGTAPFTVTSTTQVANLNVANAGYAVSAGSASTATTATSATSATTAGTVTTAAQPNITSVGTLSGLTVSGVSSLGPVGNVQITGGSNGQYLRTNGAGVLSWATVTGGGAADTGNIAFVDNTITSINTNGDIILDANGTGNVEISSADKTWTFASDGSLNLPGILILAGDSGQHIESSAGNVAIVTDANTGSNNGISVNQNTALSAKIGVGGQINLVVNSGDASQNTWTFDSYGDLAVPNYITFKDGSFIGDEGGAGTPAFRIAAPLGLGTIIQTDADISGNNYAWTFGTDGNLTIPSSGGINFGNMVIYGTTIGTTVTNQDLTLDPNGSGAVVMTSGKIALGNGQSEIISVANSSGDGNSYTTLRFIPDTSLEGYDQYLILDPTAPGHIHLRAGGTQDSSYAELILGGENSHFRVGSGTDPSVYVKANNNLWGFGSNGVLSVPGSIYGNGMSIRGDSGESYAYFELPNDANANSQSARIGNDNGNVEIGALAQGSTGRTWTFRTSGGLQFPDGSVQFTAFDLDNIAISGNTISSTNTNGDINLDPNGTGNINLSANGYTWTVGQNGTFSEGNLHLDGQNRRLSNNDYGTLQIFSGYDLQLRSYDPDTLQEYFITLGIDGHTSLPGDLTVAGNVTIQGGTTIVNTQDLTVEDSIINLHSQANLAPWTQDDGRDIGVAFHHYKGGADKHAYLVWQNDTTHLEYYSEGTESAGVISGTLGTIHANIFSANVATGTAPFIVNSTTQVANLNAATAGTVTTAAQPNITSLGTLTGLTVSGNVDATASANVSLGAVGNIKITGGTNGYVLSTDGAGTLSWVAQSGGGASTGNITFSTATISTVGTNENITLDPNGTGNVEVSGNINATGNLTLPRVISNIATGTAPFTVTSTTQVANLNVAQAGQLINGNSNVTITANSNVSVFVNGNATARTVFTSTGANIAGTANITGAVTMLSTLSVTGNANVGNIGAATAVLTTAANVPLLQNGNSNVAIAANANVTISSTGNANIVTITGTGANIAGTINATGNANLANLYNTGTLTSTGNITTTGAYGNISGANVITANTITLSSNIILSTTRTPSTAVGEAGDSTGMFAWDSDYIYVCTGNYDGSTIIWRRSSATSW